MRRLWLLGFSSMAVTASLLAQGSVGHSPAAPSGQDARVGAGSIRTNRPNILYPGSPSGGQPGSILTPGTPRSPGASALPATPGAGMRAKPPARGGRGRGRGHGGRGFLPIYGYGYGGVYIDSGTGPNAVAQDGESATASGANAITVPPRELQRPPRSRVFDVRETADGEITTRVLDHYPGEERQRAPAEYWLIALKGGLIYAADSFEERDETFRFRTLEAKEFVVPLAEVDVAFTEKLNSDLGRDFSLR